MVSPVSGLIVGQHNSCSHSDSVRIPFSLLASSNCIYLDACCNNVKLQNQAGLIPSTEQGANEKNSKRQILVTKKVKKEILLAVKKNLYS